MMNDDDYRMQHRPPSADAEHAIPAHDLTHNLPADVYTHPHYYADTHDDYFHESWSQLSRVRGKPEAKVRIYRSLPAEHAHGGFRQGDWVTTSKSYARDHGKQYSKGPEDDWPVISTVVPAKHLHGDGDSLHEWGYNGESKDGATVSFKGGRNQEVRQHADGVVRPVQRRAPKAADPLKGFSVSHRQDRDGVHHVDVYDPKGSYAGHARFGPDGTEHALNVDEDYAHLPVADRMRSKITPQPRQAAVAGSGDRDGVQSSAPASNEKDAQRLRFTEPEEHDTGGSKWPNEGEIQARHPDHGQVGSVTYFRGNRVNSPILVKMLKVHPDHQRKGYGSALMNQLQQQFPKARIKHGDRTDTGKEWWKSYGRGKADARGRTATRRPFDEVLSGPSPGWFNLVAVADDRSCEMCAGVGDYPPGSGSECGVCDGSGRDARCACGRHVVLDPSDGWQHADGSVSHDLPDGRPWADLSVAEVIQHIAAFTPHLRLFGPTFGLDHRLFDGDHLKPDVTAYILGTLDGFWRPRYGPGWTRWARVYFAGSEASEWTSPELEGNNDFDVLVGVEYDRARQDVPQFAGMSDQEITDLLNRQFREGLMPHTDPTMITIDGQSTGPWSNTFYVNPDSWDIRQIKPYAAYDVTNHEWAVKPPHLPDWNITAFPEGHALLEMGQAYETLIKAIFALPEPYRTQQANALWTYLHSDRSRAFSAQGEGWFDPGNAMEKMLDQEGLWAQLWGYHHRAEQDPTTLLAPAGWSNDPRT